MVKDSIGKDEVGGSNPPSSSRILHLNLMVWVLFLMLSELLGWILASSNALITVLP